MTEQTKQRRLITADLLDAVNSLIDAAKARNHDVHQGVPDYVLERAVNAYNAAQKQWQVEAKELAEQPSTPEPAGWTCAECGAPFQPGQTLRFTVGGAEHSDPKECDARFHLPLETVDQFNDLLRTTTQASGHVKDYLLAQVKVTDAEPWQVWSEPLVKCLTTFREILRTLETR